MRSAEGSGVALGRTLAGAAGAFMLFAAVPGFADALSVTLVWGGDEGGPAEVKIENGGTYAVPIGQKGPAYLKVEGVQALYVGALFMLVPDAGNPGTPQRIMVASGITTATGTAAFAWPEPGTYELYTMDLSPPGGLNDADDPLRTLADLFLISRAEALSSHPPVVTRFTITDASACTEKCYSNVMFLPGIEASRLYDTEDGERRLWEPGSLVSSGDEAAMQLTVNPDGTSVRSDIYTRDILDNAYVPVKGNVYKSLIADMDGLVSAGTINAWEPMPYDWRLPLNQILDSGKVIGQTDGKNNISYLQATDTPYIVQELRHLAATSKSGKVTLIAHSNGGLLAKALMQKIGDSETAKLIDKVILVASPQVGTPESIAGLLNGHGQGFSFPWGVTALSAAMTRQIGDTMPGLYNLLPSNSYFTQVDDPVVTFDASTSDMAAAYGDLIHSQERLHTFLTDASRVQPDASDLNDPTMLNDSFVTQAEQTHQALDSWTPPQGVQVIQIAGWGDPTVKGITFTRETENGVTKLEPVPQFTLDGDNTVAVPSALWMSQSDSVQSYWLNLDSYGVSVVRQVNKEYRPYTHINIFDVTPLLDFVNDEVENNSQPLSTYSYITDSAPVSTDRRLRFVLHSPLTLDLYDDEGNHTGVSTTTGEIENNIPGTYYVQYGDVKYIFASTGKPQHVVMNGYDTGTFTFEVGELQGDNMIASTTFANIPVTPTTEVTFDVSSDFSSTSDLLVDVNGDGKTVQTYASSTGELIVPALPEAEPQQTSPASSGGGNGPIVDSFPVAPVTATTAVASISVFGTTTTSVSLPTSTIATEIHVAPHVATTQKQKPITVAVHQKATSTNAAKLVAGAAMATPPKSSFLNALYLVFHDMTLFTINSFRRLF